MNESTAPQLIAEQESQLARLLGQWQQQNQLTSSSAITIREQIVHGNQVLPDNWWFLFSKGMNQALANAHQLQQQVAEAHLPSGGKWLPGWDFGTYTYTVDYMRP
ncbi:MAG: hypothetical protein AAF702_48340 [Chloroflexota bacterium]